MAILAHCSGAEQSQVHITTVLVNKCCLNNNVLRLFFLKVLIEELFLMCAGVAFHSVGAALQNSRSPLSFGMWVTSQRAMSREIKFDIHTMVHKKVILPFMIQTKLSFTNSQVSSRATRYSQSNQLYVHSRDLCVGRRSLRYSGAVLYNTLDSNIKVLDRYLGSGACRNSEKRY